MGESTGNTNREWCVKKKAVHSAILSQLSVKIGIILLLRRCTCPRFEFHYILACLLWICLVTASWSGVINVLLLSLSTIPVYFKLPLVQYSGRLFPQTIIFTYIHIMTCKNEHLALSHLMCVCKCALHISCICCSTQVWKSNHLFLLAIIMFKSDR